MKMTTRRIAVVVLALFVLPFIGGCLLINWYFSIPNTTVYEYSEYGLCAREVKAHGRLAINLLYFTLWESSAVTSIVCKVNGVDYVAYDRQNPSRQSVRTFKSYEKDLSDVTTLDGPGTIFGAFEDPRNVCFIAETRSDRHSNRHRIEGVRMIWINNHASNIVVQVRMNGIEFDVPCSQEDFIRALGDGYEEYKIVYR